ncbi:MAG: metal-dependent transcriptional regulator [Chloroflexi bacterium]|nr:metal-dependent transcriptional regulator [Chloroflexota bacterium]
MPRSRKAPSRAQAAMEDEEDGLERFSAVTENYLLCLYRLWEDAVTPTVTQLTDAIKQLPSTEGLGSSVPSVAGMTRRMQKQGLVDIGSDKRIRLTGKGFEGGEDIARRHRLAEWLVVRLLGMNLESAHIEAHRLEHGISGELEAKLRERLDYPEKSPFGRPIPGAGAAPLPPDCITLDAASGDTEYVVERIPEEDPNLLRFLDGAQIVPESRVSVAEATPYLGVMTLATPTEQVSMGFNVARQILVRPAQTEVEQA